MYVLEASEENRRAVQVIRKTYGGKRRLLSPKSKRAQLKNSFQVPNIFELIETI